MASQLARRDDREKQILSKAIEAFGTYGVRGASLREIARDANVSLTLISHHFGNKPALVAAAAESLRTVCKPALMRLRSRLEWAASLRANELIEAWIDYLDEVFGSDATRSYLRLMQRLRTDPSVEEGIRGSLDLAEPCMRRALLAAFPQAPEPEVALALEFTRNLLLTGLLRDQAAGVAASHPVAAENTERAFLVIYASSALDAALGHHANTPSREERASVSRRIGLSSPETSRD